LTNVVRLDPSLGDALRKLEGCSPAFFKPPRSGHEHTKQIRILGKAAVFSAATRPATFFDRSPRVHPFFGKFHTSHVRSTSLNDLRAQRKEKPPNPVKYLDARERALSAALTRVLDIARAKRRIIRDL